MSFEEQQKLRDKALVKMKQNLSFEGRASFVHTFQQLFNETIYAYISQLIEKYQPSKICLSGGCALNINCNTFLRNNGVDLIVPPICNDSGQSIGAALFVLRVLFHQTPGPFSIYSNGVEVDDLSIQTYLLRAGLPLKEYDPQHIAGLIRRGQVVCYMRGKSELGPRALGQRSILACSEVPGNRTKISELIKNREWFRPLAGVMRKEKFHELFGSSLYSEYMLYNYELSSSFSEIRHIDGTCRIQTLEKDFNPALYELLLEYEKLGGAILINTSLNGRNKAICQTPADVLSDFSDKAELVDSYVFNNLMLDKI